MIPEPKPDTGPEDPFEAPTPGEWGEGDEDAFGFNDGIEND